MFSSINSLLPKCFNDMFILNSTIHTHFTRMNDALHQTQYRLNCSKFALRTHGPLLWNSLPPGLKSLSNLKIFRRHYKQHLMSQLQPVNHIIRYIVLNIMYEHLYNDGALLVISSIFQFFSSLVLSCSFMYIGPTCTDLRYDVVLLCSHVNDNQMHLERVLPFISFQLLGRQPFDQLC